MKKSLVIILGLLTIFAILFFYLIKRPDQVKLLLADEGYNELWKVVIAGTIGAVISWAFAELKKEQEKREVKRQYYSQLLSKVITENNKVKKCRRILRASRVNGECIELKDYKKIMKKLEGCQLQFESFILLKIELHAFNPPKALWENFEKLEQYLADVLKRFEKGNFPQNTLLDLLTFDIPVAEFMKHYDKNDRENALFFQEFVNPLKETEKVLLKQIVK